jgi:hypothetical protein
MKSFPQGEQRLQVSQASVHKTVQDLKEYVQRCTIELGLNLDEVGISEWEDRKTGNIVVPPVFHFFFFEHLEFEDLDESIRLKIIDRLKASEITEFAFKATSIRGVEWKS